MYTGSALFVLYVLDQWFHPISSLQKSFQCASLKIQPSAMLQCNTVYCSPVIYELAKDPLWVGCEGEGGRWSRGENNFLGESNHHNPPHPPTHPPIKPAFIFLIFDARPQVVFSTLNVGCTPNFKKKAVTIICCQLNSTQELPIV